RPVTLTVGFKPDPVSRLRDDAKLKPKIQGALTTWLSRCYYFRINFELKSRTQNRSRVSGTVISGGLTHRSVFCTDRLPTGSGNRANASVSRPFSKDRDARSGP